MNTLKQKNASNRGSILKLNLAVMLFSLSGVAAQYVTVPSILVAFGRVSFSAPLLLIICIVKKEQIRLDSVKDYLLILFIGAVLALHWTSFFQSIQVSTVAIGTVTFSTFPLFLTFAEPLVFHEPFKKKSLVMALFILLGVLITVPEFSVENRMTIGILWGMLCSLTYAVITLANRYFSTKYDSKVICMYEQGTAIFVLLPALFLVKSSWSTPNLLAIAFVGVVCTALAYTIFVSTQRHIKAQTVGIISCMETVYGIVYAFVLLGEAPSVREILGGAIIVGVSVYTSLSSESAS